MVLDKSRLMSGFFGLLALASVASAGCSSTGSAGGGPVVVTDAESDQGIAAADATDDALPTSDADAVAGDAVADVASSDVPDADVAAADAPADVPAAPDADDAALPDALPADVTADDVPVSADVLPDVDAAADADVALDVAPLCIDATSCDDDDACTADTCEVTGCVHAAIANCKPATKPCDAATPCKTGVCDVTTNACVACLGNADCAPGQACAAHACVVTVPCATDMACKGTQQVCEKTAGVCVDCVTGVDCGVGQACLANACVTNAPCKSSKDCQAICDQAAGLCVECLADLDCTAGQFCSPAHTCAAKVCTGPACASGTVFACATNGSGFAPGASCDDGNPCTADGCKSTTGCTHLPATATCTDDNACTDIDLCNDGQCAPGQVTACDDKNPCTVDTCDGALGCQFAAGNDGVACSDDSTCTTGDVCGGGQCAGAKLKCDDGNACTDDACDPITGCVFSNNANSCDDGNPCSDGDTCAAGTCAAGPATVCDDGNTCTDNACDSKSGCVFLPNAATCSDGSACTATDACQNGKCSGGAGCSDGDLCTVDTCDPAVGCSFAKNACDDGDSCTTDACDATTGGCSHIFASNCCTNGKVLYTRDFDDGSTASLSVNNSSNSATKGWQVWVNAKQAHSPKNALWYGDLAQGTYNIKNSGGASTANNGTASIGPIGIPSALPPGATLQFSAWIYLDIETCVDFDKFTISATNGAKTATLWSKSDLPAGAPPNGNCSAHITLPTGWSQLTLDLPFAAGDFVTLKFAFDTMDGQYNTGTGVFVDDLQILQKCP